MQKPDKDSTSLREGSVDMETGVIDSLTGPEIRSIGLFRDRIIGVVRKGHPLIGGKMTVARYAAGEHMLVSRRDRDRGQVDDALQSLGLKRDVVAIVGGFATALALARASDLIASVPERHTATLRNAMVRFSLPVKIPPVTVSLLWHPRLDADPAHRWLRACLQDVCAERLS